MENDLGSLASCGWQEGVDSFGTKGMLLIGSLKAWRSDGLGSRFFLFVFERASWGGTPFTVSPGLF